MRDRTLAFASTNGSAPSEDILLYGTDVHQHGVPLYVGTWQLGGNMWGPVDQDEIQLVPERLGQHRRLSGTCP